MRRAIAVAAVLAFGCATLVDPYANEKGICADFYGEGSDKYKSCVVELIASQQPQYQQPQYPSSSDSGQSEQQMRNIYRQERIREQILQHGAGGCTPDFATGGCL
jgi:hypothetical protein